MNSRRVAKVSTAVRQIVSSAILFELRDPRVKHVTVLEVEVAGDMRSAKVFVSVLGDAGSQRLTMHGLESSRGFLQSRVADELQLRYTPILKFELSQGIKQSATVSRLLREMNHSSEAADARVDEDRVDEDLAHDGRLEDPAVSAADDSDWERPEPQ